MKHLSCSYLSWNPKAPTITLLAADTVRVGMTHTKHTKYAGMPPVRYHFDIEVEFGIVDSTGCSIILTEPCLPEEVTVLCKFSCLKNQFTISPLYNEPEYILHSISAHNDGAHTYTIPQMPVQTESLLETPPTDGSKTYSK